MGRTHISATNSIRRMSDISVKYLIASSRVVVTSVGIFSLSKWYLTGERVHVTELSFLFSCTGVNQSFLSRIHEPYLETVFTIGGGSRKQSSRSRSKGVEQSRKRKHSDRTLICNRFGSSLSDVVIRHCSGVMHLPYQLSGSPSVDA